MFDKNIFSIRLATLRAASGLSLEKLGKTVAVSDVAIYKLERGVNYPHCNTLCALADYFGVSLDYLAGRSDDPGRR